MKICIVITLYNPGKSYFKRFNELLDIFEFVYIYDNTESSNKYQEELRELIGNVEYNANYLNEGVAIAYNKGCCFAKKNNCSHVLFFDQDSEFQIDELKEFIKIINDRNEPSVAAYSPNIICDYVRPEKYLNKTEQEYRNWVITSGSLISLEAYNKTKGFDENLFIDLVDTDYSMAVKRLGYSLIQLPRPIMYHSLGEVKTIMGIKIYQHSPLRNYYMFRNRIYLQNKVNNNHFSANLVLKSIKHILKIILLEDGKLRKIKAIYLACKDYRLGRMGKSEHSI